MESMEDQAKRQSCVEAASGKSRRFFTVSARIQFASRVLLQADLQAVRHGVQDLAERLREEQLQQQRALLRRTQSVTSRWGPEIRPRVSFFLRPLIVVELAQNVH